MHSWKVFPSALWSEVSRTRWGTWCKMKWALCLDTGREASRLWQLGRKGAWRDFTPTPNTTSSTTPPPSAEPLDPPGNKGRFHVFNRRWGFCSRLIDSGSLFMTALVLGSITEPAGDTFSAAAHDTDTHRAAHQDTADSAVTSQMVHNIYLRFFLGHRHQSSSQPWALFSLALPSFLRLLCCSSVFPLWNGASAPLRIYFFKCMKGCFKLPNMILAAAAAALARHGDQSEIPLRVLSADSPSI